MKKQKVSEYKRLTALLLCIFFGWFGLHRFYVRKYASGFLMMFTFGGFFFMNYIDFMMILTGAFKDYKERLLINWV